MIASVGLIWIQAMILKRVDEIPKLWSLMAASFAIFPVMTIRWVYGQSKHLWEGMAESMNSPGALALPLVSTWM